MTNIKVGDKVRTEEGLIGIVKSIYNLEDYDGTDEEGRPIILLWHLIDVEFEDGTSKSLKSKDLELL